VEAQSNAAPSFIPPSGATVPDVKTRSIGATLRILYSFPHALGASGIGWTARNQAVQLAAAGHEVHVATGSCAYRVPGATSVVRTLSVGGRRVPHALLGGDAAYALHDARTARLVRRAPEPFDVVHTWPLAAERTLHAAAQRGSAGLREAPNTHTAHAYAVVAAEIARIGVDPRAASTHTPNPRRLRIEEREWDAATAVLAPSEIVRDSFVARGIARDKVLRHRYGCDPHPAARTDPGPGLRAAFVGRAEPRKGLHHALAAWRHSSARHGGRFDIYGGFAPGYRENLGQLLDQPGVHVHGFTADVPAALASADILVLPSMEEGSALVTYEAQAAGCALAVSDATGAWMVDGVHGLIHRAGDVAELTTHLNRLAGEPGVLSTMQRANAGRIDELTWRAANDDLTAAYREAIRLFTASKEATNARIG
jgi:glycosyltransferase involved in cell wall biosynthesis